MPHLILFEDDTNTFMAYHNINNLISYINFELQAINEWFQISKMSLHVNKTNFVLLMSPKTLWSAFDEKILINGMHIKQVWSAKLLGVYLDEHLTLSDHIWTDMGKVSKTCSILNKLNLQPTQSITLFSTQDNK